MKKLLLIAALLIPGLARSETIVQNAYYGLNNNSSPSVIDPAEAQDLLNVDVSITGNSFKKRSGYGLYKALATAKPIKGGHHFFDAAGNDAQVWGSSTSLYGIVGGGTPTQLISSATLASTWDCSDTQGSAYCVNSSRDAYIKTNGQTMTWFASPLGTMIEATPDRMIVGGVAASPSTIFISESNVFTNYTTGVNATDPFTEPIASPGSRLTSLRWGCGKVLWWKDQSFGTFDFDDQYNVSIKTVSDTIGTFDNTSAIDPGGNVWFRGQDGHIYRYDCAFLTKETIPITPNIQASGIRTSNFWTQDTQADFQAGASVPTQNLSTTLVAGEVNVSSFSSTVYYSSTIVGGSEIQNSSFENGTPSTVNNWTRSLTMFVGSGGCGFNCTHCGIIGPKDGSWTIASTAGGATWEWGIYAYPADTLISSTTINDSSFNCTWTNVSVNGAGASGQTVRARLRENAGVGPEAVSDPFVSNGNNIGIYWVSDNTNSGGHGTSFDLVNGGGVLTVSSQTFTTATYDTGFTSSVVQIQANWSATIATATYSLRSSTATNGTFANVLTSTGTNGVANRYVTIAATVSFPTGGVLTATTTVISRSTGTYFSAVKNAPILSAWDFFQATKLDNSGSHSFFVRSSTSTFTVLSSTPSWVAQSIGALVSASTGTFFQVRDDFALSYATAAPTLQNFTVSWFEGSPTDQSYMEYFDNAVWASVAFGAGQSTNNYIFKCDLLRYASDPSKSCWTLYNFGAGGMLVQNDTLFFGDTAAGNVYDFGTVTNDNGTAINAYRKSKEYTGTDPFMQNQLTQIDTFAKKDNGTTLTATYTTEGITSTSYSVLLTTGSIIAQSRKLLPSGKLGYTFNMQYGDTSTSSAWEVFGYRITFAPQPYRPTTP